MKRKEIDDEDLYDGFSHISLSLHSRKSRRLDGELLPDMQIEQAPEVPISEQVFLNEHLRADNSVLEQVLVDNPVEERALVLYNPANSSLAKSPRSPEISINVHADLIPGLKDYFHQWGNSFGVKAATSEEMATVSDNHLAVVPWDPSQHPLYLREEKPSGDASDPMEAEADAEMMDMEDDTTSSAKQCFEPNGMVRGTGGLQPWPQQQQQQQQYCLTPQLFQNINMSVW